MVLVVGGEGVGGELWRRTFGGGGNERATDVAVLPGGGFALLLQAGHPEACVPSSSSDPPCEDMTAAVIGTDAEGRERWRHEVSGPGLDRLFYLDVASGGDLVATGITSREPGGDFDVLALRLGPGGELRWRRTFGGGGYAGPYRGSKFSLLEGVAVRRFRIRWQRSIGVSPALHYNERDPQKNQADRTAFTEAGYRNARRAVP